MKLVFNLFITEQSIFDASHTSASSNGAFEHITIHTMTGDIMSPSHHYINLLYASVIYMHEPNGISSIWIDDSVYIHKRILCMDGLKEKEIAEITKGTRHTVYTGIQLLYATQNNKKSLHAQHFVTVVTLAWTVCALR